MQNLRKRINLALFLIAGFFVLTGGSASASVSECDYSQRYDNPQTVYIDATGSDDQDVINAAVQQVDGVNKTSVFLKEGEYVISGTINLKDTIMLEGDKGAVVRLEDHAGWPVATPLITAPDGANNIEIKCFEIDMNYENNYSQLADSCFRPLSWNSNFSDCESKTDDRLVGRGYYDVAYLHGGRNYSMHDMFLHHGAGDGFKIEKGSNVKFYDNLVYKLGHDAVSFSASNYVEAWRNRITVRTNSGVRADNSNYVSIHDNVIESYDNWDAGGPGVLIAKDDRGTIPMNAIKVYNNTFHHTYGPGVQVIASGTYGKSDTAASIHHNVFYETGLSYDIAWVGGVVTSGFYDLKVVNNTFDRVYNYGVAAMLSANGVSGSGYVVTVKNNIFNETQHRRNSAGKESEQGGVAVANLLPDTHTIELHYNDIWESDHLDTDGLKINISDLMDRDPLFVNETGHDYHLKQESPAIDAGDPSDGYSSEPDPSGGRIDLGRYGNTDEAGGSASGVATSINTENRSDGTGSGNYTGNDTGGSGSGGSAIDPNEGQAPSYWDPTAAVTETSYITAVEPAQTQEEKALEALYGPLGESATTSTVACSSVEGSGGLIPCGRHTNDPSTPWNECQSCDLCGIVLMGQLTVEFMVKIAAIAANLAIIFAGLLYIFAAGQTALIAQSKSVMKYTLLGFIVIFAAWVIVDTLLTMLGYIDPLEGAWYTIC